MLQLHRKQKLLSLFDKKDPCFVCNVAFSNTTSNTNDNILEKFCYFTGHYLALDLEKIGPEQSSSLLLPLTTTSLNLADYLKNDSKLLDYFSGHLDQKICGGCLPAVKSFCDIYERVNNFSNDDHDHDEATSLTELNDSATKIAELMKKTTESVVEKSKSKNGEFYGITSDNLRERLKKRGALRRDNFRKQFILKTGFKLDPDVNVTPIQVPDELKLKVEDSEPNASNAKDGNVEPLLIEEFACRHCEKKFRSGKHRRNHERIHTGFFPFKCSSCGKQFAQQHYLTIHERLHTGEKPYRCSLCSEGFGRRNGWKRHNVKVHNGEGNVIIKYNDDNDDKSRPWKCNICGRGHFDKHLLRLHQRMHRNKPFACHVCGKEFIRLKNCKMHLETTHGKSREELQEVHVQGLIKVNDTVKSKTDLPSRNFKLPPATKSTTATSSFHDNEIGKVEVKQEKFEPEPEQDDHDQQGVDITSAFLVPVAPSLVKVEIEDFKIKNEDDFILPH